MISAKVTVVVTPLAIFERIRSAPASCNFVNKFAHVKRTRIAANLARLFCPATRGLSQHRHPCRIFHHSPGTPQLAPSPSLLPDPGALDWNVALHTRGT